MYLVALLTLIIQGCHMGSRVIASLLAISLGANEALIGLLIATYSFFPLALAVYSGRISDRFGSFRPMFFGSILLGLALLLPAVWPTLTMLFVSALLLGIGYILFNVSVQNLAGAIGRPEERTRNFSILALGYSGGHMSGPLIAGFGIDLFSHASTYLCFALLAFGSAALLAWSPRGHDQAPAGPRGSRSTLDLMREPRLRRALLISGLITTGFDLFIFYVPIYGHGIGLSATTIGLLLGTFAGATFVVRFTLPLFTGRYGVELVLATAALAGGAQLLVFPFIEFLPVLYLLSFGIGIALGCGQPLTLNLCYNRSPPGRSGEVTGMRLTINNVMHIAVPLAAGSVGALLGTAPVFWAAAGCLAAGARFTRKT